jgi:hypothetical protein
VESAGATLRAAVLFHFVAGDFEAPAPPPLPYLLDMPRPSPPYLLDMPRPLQLSLARVPRSGRAPGAAVARGALRRSEESGAGGFGAQAQLDAQLEEVAGPCPRRVFRHRLPSVDARPLVSE